MHLRIAFVTVIFSALAANASPTCSKPAVRQDWDVLSTAEKSDFIKSINCLSTLPHDPSLTTMDSSGLPELNKSSSFYDDLVFMHMDLSDPTHDQGLWLPWHRWYINAFEGVLKDKCGFQGTLPYWNWTKHADDFEHASIFDDDPESGWGGWGDPTQDFQITNGGFKNFHVSYPNYHRPRRNFTLQPYTTLNRTLYPIADLTANDTFSAPEVRKMIEDFDGDFQSMSSYIDGKQGARWGVHLIMGGDLADECPSDAVGCVTNTKWSPNDPLFWIHHVFLDKIWYDWQYHNVSANFYNFSPDASLQNFTTDTMIPSDTMLESTTYGSVLDTKGGFLCYTYD
ncbi:hypothetical protein PLICRDRAFT_104279 [Plicaturopsis crispa FD-325 SS-3]|nr:hypothetical protein PLICRDRAFT_104279 [Plicaturopsis crispa FD-325 SS-3]